MRCQLCPEWPQSCLRWPLWTPSLKWLSQPLCIPWEFMKTNSNSTPIYHSTITREHLLMNQKPLQLLLPEAMHLSEVLPQISRRQSTWPWVKFCIHITTNFSVSCRFCWIVTEYQMWSKMMRLVFEFLIDDFLNEKCLTSTVNFIASQFKGIVQNSVFFKSSKKFIFPTSFTSCNYTCASNCYNRLKFFPDPFTIYTNSEIWPEKAERPRLESRNVRAAAE